MPAGAPLNARKLLQRGAQELERGGIHEGRWEAERLLRHALGLSRETLFTRLNEPVQAEAAGVFFQLVDRRRGRVPLQYLLGVQEFWGLDFRVTPAVFIPRPETELLVEESARRLGGRRVTVADIGSGSGCISVALARELSEATVLAIEISPAALAIAQENAARHGVGDRIRFLHGDLLEPVGRDMILDAVVSNPPYVPDADFDALAPEIREHEPRLAFAAGEDGLGVLRRLLAQARERLSTGGPLILEIGQGMELSVRHLLAEYGFHYEETREDLQGIPRVIVATSP